MLYDGWRYKLQRGYHVPLPPFSLVYPQAERYTARGEIERGEEGEEGEEEEEEEGEEGEEEVNLSLPPNLTNKRKKRKRRNKGKDKENIFSSSFSSSSSSSSSSFSFLVDLSTISKLVSYWNRQHGYKEDNKSVNCSGDGDGDGEREIGIGRGKEKGDGE